MSYRPQSPDLSSYAPRSPNLSTTYRPQSPDLSGLGNPDLNTALYSRNHLMPAYSEQPYRGPTTGAFTATSNPTDLPQPSSYPQPYPQHSMALHKDEDADYLPDAPTRHARRQPQQPQPSLSTNGSSTQQMAPSTTSNSSDPTHGVALKTSFPVARIKRIMQADEDIGKVAQVTPHVVSRALELFMIKLITASTEQARGPAAGKGPKRVLAQHMKAAIKADDTFDFLAEIIAKVPDAPVKAKKEAGSESDEVKPKRKGKKRKDSGDDF